MNISRPSLDVGESRSGNLLWQWSPKAGDEPPATLADKAMNLIYNDIVAARLDPGQKLKPEDLSAEYGIGTSPIREALLRLSSEGLVRLEGQRGFRVPETSEAELMDIASVRLRLSVWALRDSIERGDDEWESLVVGAFHKLEKIAPLMKKSPQEYREEWELRNREFHAALESACGSLWLLRFCHIAYSQSERYRRHTIEYQKLLPAVQNEHQAIMEAAIHRRANEACAHLEHHIRQGVEKVRKALLRDKRLA